VYDAITAQGNFFLEETQVELSERRRIKMFKFMLRSCSDCGTMCLYRESLDLKRFQLGVGQRFGVAPFLCLIVFDCSAWGDFVT